MPLHPFYCSCKKSQRTAPSFIHSFFHSLLTGKFARAVGAALWHPALQDTRSGDDKNIKPWKLPVPGGTASSAALSPSAVQLHTPPTAKALLREQPGSPTTTGHFLKEIFCALSLKRSNAHEQWKFSSDWKTDLQRDLDHHHMKELFFLTDWELFINSELKQWNFKSSCGKVLVSGFSQYLFSEVIATTESKKMTHFCWFYLLSLAPGGLGHNMGNAPSDQQGCQMLGATC